MIKRNIKGQFNKGNASGQMFKKGNIPFNKGTKGIMKPNRTSFKKGITTLQNHPNWQGGIQKMSNDCIYIAIATNKRIRRPRKIYQEHYGDIPNGYIIYHINGNKTDDKLSNLQAISRAELLKINQSFYEKKQ